LLDLGRDLPGTVTLARSIFQVDFLLCPIGVSSVGVGKITPVRP